MATENRDKSKHIYLLIIQNNLLLIAYNFQRAFLNHDRREVFFEFNEFS